MSWFAILRHAPAILAAADALFVRTKSWRAEDQTRTLEARLAELAEEARASAQLTQEMAQQIHALAMLSQTTAWRARLAVGLAAASAVVAAAALIVAIVR